MDSEWREFLESAGAEFYGDTIESFGNPEQERHVVSSGDIICDLSHLAVLEISGDDGDEFLQNQLTNDIGELTEKKSQLSGWCTPKGRLLVLFQVIRQSSNKTLLLFPIELLEPIQKRLQMFVMRSKVTITNISEQRIRIGLSGPDAEEQLGAITESIPKEIDETINMENTTVVRLHPALYPRFLILTDLPGAKKTWSHLDVQATPVSSGPWELLDIRSAIPTITQRTQESFIPQMLNLQAINGLNFTKGCYPGQEVVARMEYLGKMKRGMARITIVDESSPESGDSLYSRSSNSSQGAGEIISIQKDGDGVWEGLAVVETGIIEAGDITLMEDGTVPVMAQQLNNR